MSKIQWERELVERPFCQQLERLGWQWIEGDPDLPETTERTSSREVLLKGRLAAALKKLNLRETTPDVVFAMLQKYQDMARRKAGETVAMTIARR